MAVNTIFDGVPTYSVLRVKEHAWVSKKLGRSGERVSKKGEGVGRKGIACSESQTFYQTLFAHELEAIVKFDWLLACQSTYDIRNLSFMHNPTPEITSKIR